MTGTLTIVPTPIGNLEDITLRALQTLRDADLIVCEDTRHSLKLLTHYQISKPLVSFFTYNQFRRLPQIMEDLKAGKKVALVSDSGTPGVSDPGQVLVAQAIADGIPVISLPGPSAVITALAGSGLPTDGFVFLGFLRRKAGKLKKELAQAAQQEKTIVFYESPFRIKKTLALAGEVFPADTKIVVARELTKTYEEYIRGTLESVRREIEGREIKGEIVVLVAPQANDDKVNGKL